MVRFLTIIFSTVAVAGCSPDMPERVLSDGGEGDAGPTVDPASCSSDSECTLGCHGLCCACPESVSSHLFEVDPEWLPPLPDGTCDSRCNLPCPNCRAAPEPACADGVCVSREGCARDEDCTLAYDCACGCVEAVSRAAAADDSCLVTPVDEGRDGCDACRMVDVECRGCLQEPDAAVCSPDGRCIPDYGDPYLAPCGGLSGPCPRGYFCYPDATDCGLGTTGVCFPMDAGMCSAAHATPCRQAVQACLDVTIPGDFEGACLSPQEKARVCESTPGCFDCGDAR